MKTSCLVRASSTSDRAKARHQAGTGWGLSREPKGRATLISQRKDVGGEARDRTRPRDPQDRNRKPAGQSDTQRTGHVTGKKCWGTTRASVFSHFFLSPHCYELICLHHHCSPRMGRSVLAQAPPGKPLPPLVTVPRAADLQATTVQTLPLFLPFWWGHQAGQSCWCWPWSISTGVASSMSSVFNWVDAQSLFPGAEVQLRMTLAGVLVTVDTIHYPDTRTPRHTSTVCPAHLVRRPNVRATNSWRGEL